MLVCAGFQPSNVRDKLKISPCHTIGGKGERKESEKIVESNSGIEMEIDAYYDNLLIRGF